MNLLGRKLAVTTVKAKKHAEDPDAETMTLEEIADLSRRTIVGTAIGVGSVTIAVATAITCLRITEIVAKSYFR